MPNPKNSVYTESKICPKRARIFFNRKRFESRNQWQYVKYCSNACRKKK